MPIDPENEPQKCTITHPNYMNARALRAVMEHLMDSASGITPPERAFTWVGAETRKSLIPLPLSPSLPSTRVSKNAKASSSKVSGNLGSKPIHKSGDSNPTATAQPSSADAPKLKKPVTLQPLAPAPGKPQPQIEPFRARLQRTALPDLDSDSGGELPEPLIEEGEVFQVEFRKLAIGHPEFLPENFTAKEIIPSWSYDKVRSCVYSRATLRVANDIYI